MKLLNKLVRTYTKVLIDNPVINKKKITVKTHEQRNSIILSFCFVSLYSLYLHILPIYAFTNTTLHRLNSLSLNSQNAYIVNLESDTAIYEKESTEKVSPASLTKLVTALVVRDYATNQELNQTVVISADMLTPLIGTGATLNELRPNDVVSIYDLLKGMLIESGADSSNALATFIEQRSGQSFASLMNQKAIQIGMHDSSFVNAHGLDDPNQYTTAQDIGKLGKEVMLDSLLVEILSTYESSLQVTGPNARTIVFRAPLQPMNQAGSIYIPGVKWGKTGYTKDAQRCVLAYLKHDELSFLVVLMRAPIPLVDNHHATNQDLKAIAQELFENYRLVYYSSDHNEVSELAIRRPLKHGKVLNDIQLIPNRPVVLFVSNDVEVDDISITYRVPQEILSPIAAGETLGYIDFIVNEKRLSSIPMVSTISVDSIYDRTGLTTLQRSLNQLWPFMLVALLAYQGYVMKRMTNSKMTVKTKRAFADYYSKSKKMENSK